MKNSPESALSRLEPRKKSISMRNTNAFDDGFTVWLRRNLSVRTLLESIKQSGIYQNRYQFTHQWRMEVALIGEESTLSSTI